MFSFSRANHIIENGKVINSTIDMNNGIITNHEDPIVPLDVANKRYVDLYNIKVITLTLTGTNYTTILNDQSGVIDLLIKNIVLDGPTAHFNLCKSEVNRDASITKINNTPGHLTEERLIIKWVPNSGIELAKTGPNYDGTYRIKYIINN